MNKNRIDYSKVRSFIAPFVALFIIGSIFFRFWEHPWKQVTFVVLGSVSMFAVLTYVLVAFDEYFRLPADKIPPKTKEAKSVKLKWTRLINQRTWEDTLSFAIRRARRGWRLPTREELQRKIHPPNFCCWLDNGEVFSSSTSKQVVATRAVKKHFYLVREI